MHKIAFGTTWKIEKAKMKNSMNTINRSLLQRCTNVTVRVGLGTAMSAMMERHCFSLAALANIVRTITVQYPNRMLLGVGLRNDNGGVEFFEDDYLSAPVTLMKCGIITMPYRPRERSRRCCFFENILDYFAYISVLKRNDEIAHELPVRCDCIIVCESSNYVQAMLDSESYEKTYLICPNTIVGKTMARTMRARNPNNTEDLSPLYLEAASLYHIMREQRESGNKQK